eukprot:TRINITY_DN2241_c0_g1_i2.p1 TRINITY_DN2241_c0_g1~~TRINITY_DN2241_c0_g1_i2.p1  ORF type:complete len:250 (-),score=61.02 TRINITY_DN2241_c0_g1_i2:134-883(-)
MNPETSILFGGRFDRVNVDEPNLEWLKQREAEIKRRIAADILKRPVILPPKAFHTVLETRRAKEIEEERRREAELQREREEYYNAFVLPSEEDREPETFVQIVARPSVDSKALQNVIVDYNKFIMDHGKGMDKQLATIGHDLDEFYRENERLLAKTKDTYLCKNLGLLERMLPIVMNELVVNIDDVIESIIDELMVGEVKVLNLIEEMKQKGSKAAPHQPKDEEGNELPSELKGVFDALENYAENELWS